MLRIFVNGRPIEAMAGQSVAAALWASGIRTLRRSPREGAPRGAFCMMGVCQECLVAIDGDTVQSCLVAVEPDLRVTIAP